MSGMFEDDVRSGDPARIARVMTFAKGPAAGGFGQAFKMSAQKTLMNYGQWDGPMPLEKTPKAKAEEAARHAADNKPLAERDPFFAGRQDLLGQVGPGAAYGVGSGPQQHPGAAGAAPFDPAGATPVPGRRDTSRQARQAARRRRRSPQRPRSTIMGNQSALNSGGKETLG